MASAPKRQALPKAFFCPQPSEASEGKHLFCFIQFICCFGKNSAHFYFSMIKSEFEIAIGVNYEYNLVLSTGLIK